MKVDIPNLYEPASSGFDLISCVFRVMFNCMWFSNTAKLSTLSMHYNCQGHSEIFCVDNGTDAILTEDENRCTLYTTVGKIE